MGKWTLFLFIASSGTLGGQWERFRGPNGSGVLESGDVPAEFGPDRNLVWKTALPPGHSSPVVTMTVYAHVLPSMQADAAKKLGSLLHG